MKNLFISIFIMLLVTQIVYANDLSNIPIDEGTCKYRVIRGGSWFNKPDGVRCSARHGIAGDVEFYDTGLRLVLIAQEQSASENIKKENSIAGTQQQKTTVEQSGICKGLDLSITADIRNCLGMKYKVADKELNRVYKQLMSRLDEPRKLSLKKEQIAWIMEKESKCQKAGKESEGGSLEAVMIEDCLVQMTEQRVIYLKRIH